VFWAQMGILGFLRGIMILCGFFQRILQVLTLIGVEEGQIYFASLGTVSKK
jgi:hypothetical protein